jgi:uncharacterized protein
MPLGSTWMSDQSEAVVDAYVHHAWASPAELAAYLPRAWQEFIGRPGTLPGGGGMMPFVPESPYRNPLGEKVAAAYVGGAVPGSSLQVLRDQVLDGFGVERAVLGFDAGMLITVHPNHYLGRELVRAANDWSIDRWLSGQDDRLYGLLLVPNQLPEQAAVEIRRVGSHPRIAGVLMGGNGLGKPFGHPVYHPIYEAAYELGLPVVVHAGADAPPDTLTEATAAGPCFTYAEAHLLAAHGLITHAVSLVGQGVFLKWPDLRVLMAGAGVTWLLTMAWRYDNEYKALRREVPWLDEMPSRYLERNLRLTTYPLDAVGSDRGWKAVFNAFPGLESMVCFASGYPNWDMNAPAEVASALPPSLRRRVLHDNADSFFRWAPFSRSGQPRPEAGVGVMGG